MAQEEDYGASNSGETPCITHGGRVMNQVIQDGYEGRAEPSRTCVQSSLNPWVRTEESPTKGIKVFIFLPRVE